MSGEARRILVVDDEPLVLRTIARILSFLGYAVLEARSGEAALALVGDAAGAVDLLVTDIGMPGIDGRALAAELRRRAPGLRVLFISGRGSFQAVRGAVAGDPRAAALAKPFTREELAEAVGGLLDRCA